MGEVDEGEVSPFRLPVRWQLWDFLWDEEAAVAGEALEDDILE